jgi:hypothetical protein
MSWFLISFRAILMDQLLAGFYYNFNFGVKLDGVPASGVQIAEEAFLPCA